MDQKQFEDKITFLCRKFASSMRDTIYSYEDLKQDAEVLKLEIKLREKQPIDFEQYFLRAFKNYLIDAANLSKLRKVAQNKFYEQD